MIVIRVSILAALWLSLAPGQAQAQSVLDKYLKKSTQSSAAESGGAGDPSINKVYEGKTGFWRLDDTRSSGGFCAVTYYASPYYAGYVGPVAGKPDAFILFSGPTIPPIKKGKNKKMTLTTADGIAQTVPAFHAPNPEQKDSGLVIFKLTDIEAAMDEMSDAEHVGIGLGKEQVFSIKWEGGHTARAAMRKCLSGSAEPAGDE